MKRFLTAALSLAMVLTLLPVSAQAAATDFFWFPGHRTEAAAMAEVTPESYNLVFSRDGEIIETAELDADAGFWDAVRVPTRGAHSWTYGDLTVEGGDRLTASALNRLDWTEENPTVIFTADENTIHVTYRTMEGGIFHNDYVGEADITIAGVPYTLSAEDCADTMPAGYRFVKSECVMSGWFSGDYVTVYVEEAPAPTAFTLRFVDPTTDEVVAEDTAVVGGEDAVAPADLNGSEMVAWENQELELTLAASDAISGAELLDMKAWDDETPVVVFDAVEILPESFKVQILDPVTKFPIIFTNPETHEEQDHKILTDGDTVSIPRMIVSEDAMVDSWYIQGIEDVEFATGDKITFQQLLELKDWNEIQPTVIITANVVSINSEEPEFQGFDIKFVNPTPDGEKFIVNDSDGSQVWHIDAGESVMAPRMVLAGVVADWFADCIDYSVMPSHPICADELLENFQWEDENPTIIFRLVPVNDDGEPILPEEPEEPETPAAPVLPDGFNVVFKAADGTVLSTQYVDAWGFYTLVNIPAGYTFVAQNSNMDGMTVTNGDYLSGQTLDLDFNWYETIPTVEFIAQ